MPQVERPTFRRFCAFPEEAGEGPVGLVHRFVVARVGVVAALVLDLHVDKDNVVVIRLESVDEF